MALSKSQERAAAYYEKEIRLLLKVAQEDLPPEEFRALKIRLGVASTKTPTATHPEAA